MDPERWNQVDGLFHRMLALESEQRGEALRQATGGDEELLREVASLLAAHEDEISAGGRWSTDTAVSRLAHQLLDRKTEGAEAPGPGEMLGRFRVLDLLGVGGMGTVYRAFDPELRRVVALKVLAPAAGAQARERLVNEARAASALRHPAIATIHEICEDRGTAFLVMECVEGETLARRLQDGPLPVRDAVDVALQVSEALAEAHRHGIVHRDVKPANVMLIRRGRVKVLDFGIAQPTPPVGGPLAEGAGPPLGTPEAMSPEQATGGPVDRRSDLFSLGVLLHHMLTGRSPFAGATLAETLQRLRDAPAPPLPAGVPAELERVVARCLAKQRERRYPSAGELVADLRAVARLATAEPRRGRPAGRGAAGSWRRWLVSAAILIAVAAAAALVADWRASGGGSSSIRSLAVLPFADLSPPPRAGYFADGLTEALTTELAKIGALRVTAHSSVLPFRDSLAPVSAVARRLGVDALLTGSVTRAEGRVRVTVQLVNGATERGLWAESYERTTLDMLDMQVEVAHDVAREIRLRLTAADEDRLRHSAAVAPEAYESYLRGRYFLNRREAALEKAIASFSAAIRRQPDYALAYVGLADCYALQGSYRNRPPATTYPRAEAAARRALAFDPDLGGAHAVLGLVQHEYRWNHRAAERSYRRAIALSPGDSAPYQWYAEMLTRLGRFPEATAAIHTAQRLDPLSLSVNSVAGWVDTLAGRPDAAVVELRRTLDLNASFGPAWSFLGLAYGALGRYPEAVAAHREAVRLSGRQPRPLADLAITLAQSGRPQEARALLAEIEADARNERTSAFYRAGVHLALGEREEALDWLERAFEQQDLWLLFLKVDPRFAALRGEPHFEALLTRTGLR